MHQHPQPANILGESSQPVLRPEPPSDSPHHPHAIVIRRLHLAFVAPALCPEVRPAR